MNKMVDIRAIIIIVLLMGIIAFSFGYSFGMQQGYAGYQKQYCTYYPFLLLNPDQWEACEIIP